MVNRISSNSQQKIARMAGLLYTLMIPLSVFGMMNIPSKIIISGNIEGTISNILNNINISSLMVLFMLISIPITIIDELNNYAILFFATNNGTSM